MFTELIYPPDIDDYQDLVSVGNLEIDEEVDDDEHVKMMEGRDGDFSLQCRSLLRIIVLNSPLYTYLDSASVLWMKILVVQLLICFPSTNINVQALFGAHRKVVWNTRGNLLKDIKPL